MNPMYQATSVTQQSPAQPGGSELRHQGPADGVLGADRDAHHQAHQEQLPGLVDEELHHRPGAEQQHVRHEQRLAAELVGGPAASGDPTRMPSSAEAAIRPSQSSEMPSSSEIGPITVPDDSQDVAVDEHSTDQHGHEPGHEAALEGLRGGVRLGRCVLIEGTGHSSWSESMTWSLLCFGRGEDAANENPGGFIESGQAGAPQGCYRGSRAKNGSLVERCGQKCDMRPSRRQDRRRTQSRRARIVSWTPCVRGFHGRGRSCLRAGEDTWRASVPSGRSVATTARGAQRDTCPAAKDARQSDRSERPMVGARAPALVVPQPFVLAVHTSGDSGRFLLGRSVPVSTCRGRGCRADDRASLSTGS